jgi:hypothetical protein
MVTFRTVDIKGPGGIGRHLQFLQIPLYSEENGKIIGDIQHLATPLVP